MYSERENGRTRDVPPTKGEPSMRLLTPMLAFLLVFVVVYTITTLSLATLWPVSGGVRAFPPDITGSWQAVPGLALGLLAATHSALATYRVTKPRKSA